MSGTNSTGTTAYAPAPASGGYYARRQAQREMYSPDEDSQDRDDRLAAPYSGVYPSPQKSTTGGKFACMIDSNPELNPARDRDSNSMQGEDKASLNKKKKMNLNSHITDKFKDLYKIYEMVST